MADKDKDISLRRRKKTDGSSLPSRFEAFAYEKLLGQTFVDPAQESNLYIIAGITLIAIIVRLFRISNPSEVVFDEVHFGGFASKYIKGAFFMDVHPPLGKLLVAATGVVSGFNGNFDFKEIGLDYLKDKVPYVTMRLLPGLLGVLLVPMSYITMRNMGFSNPSSVMTAAAILFENGLATQSRLILLDSYLVFFTGLTVMMWTDFLSNQEVPFTFTWWYPLVMTGVGLGLAASVKWVGLFLIALIGLSTINNLWIILGDMKTPPSVFGRHFAARALCLIVVPTTLYMFFFQIHFWVLPRAGTGSGFMSPEFQSTLKGNEIEDTYRDVAFGSTVYLRHVATNGGYLHSHKHDYETGSKQQQITLYPFRDDNSAFRIGSMITTINGTTMPKPVNGLEYLKDGDIIKLEHVPTFKHLHSHDHRPPVTENEHHNEVSCYGQENYQGDTNDHWRVEVFNPVGSEKLVRAISTKIRLHHVNTQCQLFSHAVKLPEYAFGQQEVTCAKNGRTSHTLWIIEYNVHPLYSKDAKMVNYKKMGFFRKLIESHQVMWKINSGLTSSHPYDSRPIAWPTLRRGISFWTAKNNQSGQIYLLGNPIVWWLSTFAVFVFVVFFGAAVILRKRDIDVIQSIYLSQTADACILLFGGWFLHYFPFFLMRRQLFLHHYFPALYFAILLCGALFDLATHRLKPATKWMVVGIYLFVVVWTYLAFSPITYGFAMSRRHCERLKWGKHWDWSCLSSPEETHLYPPKPADAHKDDIHKKVPSPEKAAALESAKAIAAAGAAALAGVAGAAADALKKAAGVSAAASPSPAAGAAPGEGKPKAGPMAAKDPNAPPTTTKNGGEAKPVGVAGQGNDPVIPPTEGAAGGAAAVPAPPAEAPAAPAAGAVGAAAKVSPVEPPKAPVAAAPPVAAPAAPVAAPVAAAGDAGAAPAPAPAA